MKGIDLTAIHEFLETRTPKAWLDAALEYPEELLIDHCNCEKKAAGTALNLIFKYTERPELLMKMSKLAREELRHFEQVLSIMKKRGINYRPLTASRYAKGLAQHIRSNEPYYLVDRLIVGALIEARSCERFASLAPLLDEELQKFYLSLLKSEARHFMDYLSLARQYSDEPIEQRIAFFKAVENDLISSADTEFRFHSGVPSQ